MPKNSDEFHPEISQEKKITLEMGSLDEITRALQNLGASSTVQAQASTSFLVKLQPGTVVQQINGGFQIGRSIIRETPQLSSDVVGRVYTNVIRTLSAANDESYARAA